MILIKTYSCYIMKFPWVIFLRVLKWIRDDNYFPAPINCFGQ